MSSPSQGLFSIKPFNHVNCIPPASATPSVSHSTSYDLSSHPDFAAVRDLQIPMQSLKEHTIEPMQTSEAGPVKFKKPLPKKPLATRVKIGKNPKWRCLECNVSSVETPHIRKGPAGKSSLCNKCGLRWSKLQKGNVIKPAQKILCTPKLRWKNLYKQASLSIDK